MISSEGRAALPRFILAFCALNCEPNEVQRTLDLLSSFKSADADLVRQTIEHALASERIRPRRSTRVIADEELTGNGASSSATAASTATEAAQPPPLLSVGCAGRATVFRLIHARRVALDDGLPSVLAPSQYATIVRAQNVAMRQQALVKEVTSLTGQPRFYALLDDALVEAVEETTEPIQPKKHTGNIKYFLKLFFFFFEKKSLKKI